MASFDLGDAVGLTRAVGVGIEEAFARSKALLAGYEGQGFQVRFSEAQPPARLAAEVSDASGTRLHATVELRPTSSGSALELRLRGQVVVGGMKGMLASERQVRQVASERLAAFVDAKFPPGETWTAPAEAAPAPEAAPEPAAPAGGVEGKLALVRDLFERGLIDEEDYRSKKAELLDRL
ncbi:MAG: SHOCT domain-containing protein [Planctomycetes bacterium]|nr:SHOCT domain-containing protein [Planctomycetota bacterium]